MSALDTRKTRALGDLLGAVARDFAPAALASSLSAEDMVLTDAIFRAGLAIEVFTLDTGRLHRDTLDLVAAIEHHYGRTLRVVEPDAAAVAAYVADHGADAFYTSLELRKRCCAIRKVEPLARALRGKRAWLTGLRRAQAVTRDTLALQSHDAAHGIEKFNPLVDWSEEEVWTYVREHRVPYNRLHDQGYRSIGCAPCTRPTVTGEEARAGRWWWELPSSKECGLHVAHDGGLVRTREEATA